MKKLILTGLILMINIACVFPQTGKLVGKVTDEKNEPVIDAGIQLTGEETYLATTDTNGYFMLENIGAGEYEISIKNSGYKAQSQMLEIPGDKTTTINIVLKKDKAFIEEFAIKVVELIISIIK